MHFDFQNALLVDGNLLSFDAVHPKVSLLRPEFHFAQDFVHENRCAVAVALLYSGVRVVFRELVGCWIATM